MIKKLKEHSHLLHKAGLWLSFLCLIHCLATPFVITLLPVIGERFVSETTEFYLIGLSLAIGLFLMIRDYGIHKNAIPLILLSVSAVFNFSGFFFVFLFVWVVLNYFVLFLVSLPSEKYYVVSGASVMAAAYVFNWWKHRTFC